MKRLVFIALFIDLVIYVHQRFPGILYIYFLIIIRDILDRTY